MKKHAAKEQGKKTAGGTVPKRTARKGTRKGETKKTAKGSAHVSAKRRTKISVQSDQAVTDIVEEVIAAVSGTDTKERAAIGAKDNQNLTAEDAANVTAQSGNEVEVAIERAVVKLDRKEILEALKVAVEVSEGKSVLPILSCVRLTASGNECRLSATNLEIGFVKALSATVSQPVDICVPGKVLYQEIRALSGEINDVELRFNDRSVSVNLRCAISTHEADEFPELVGRFVHTLKVRGLVESLGRVIPAVSTDETRFVLTGVCLDLPRNKVVASDGFRLHYDHVDIDRQSAEQIGQKMAALIVPPRAAKVLLKHKGEDEILFQEPERSEKDQWVPRTHVAFKVAGGLLITRLMVGQFPDYATIMPALPPVKITFAAAEFLNLLDGATPLADSIVQLRINGDLTIYAARDVGNYEWHIPCETELPKGMEEMAFSFNPKFLVGAIRSFPADRVVLNAPLTYGACVFNEKAIIMPVRL